MTVFVLHKAPPKHSDAVSPPQDNVLTVRAVIDHSYV